jgi:adenylate cyclase
MLGFPIAYWAGVSLPVSMVHGTFIGGLSLAFKHRLLLRRLHDRIVELPRAQGLLALYLTYAFLIVAGIGLALIVGVATGLDDDDGTPNIDFFQVFSYSAASVILLLLLDQSRSLIGNQVFFALITGRYARPVEERRLFLAIDMANSTQLAARLGDREAMRIVGRFLHALGEPVRHHGGSIDKYVGDQAIISWRLTDRRPQAPALACALAIRRVLTDLRKEMDVGLGFRIAIHAGPVIVAQVGDERREITYFGDTINCLARLDGIAKEAGRDIILTGDGWRHCRPVAGVTPVPLGTTLLRGRDTPMEIVGLPLP